MTLVMLITLFVSPVTSSASEKTLSDTDITYINSDGEEIPAYETEDGLVYTKSTNGSETEASVIGYRGTGKNITVPETLGGAPVVSFAIDPRWPVVDELYDSIENISLPATIESANPEYMYYFQGLRSISIAPENERYKSANGVLYEYNSTGCEISVYPLGKTDKTYVMPSDMNKMFTFYYGCPVESLTMSKSIAGPYDGEFSELDNLKEIKVESGNPEYSAKEGVLFRESGDFDGKCLTVYPQSKSDSTYTVPAGTTRIAKEAFAYNAYVRTVVIPESVTAVESTAFYYTENLWTIEFTQKNAPTNYPDYQGIRDLMEDMEGTLTIDYPADGAGWEDFIAWLEGKEVNSWEEEPHIDSTDPSAVTVPLGSNLCPVKGTSLYGTPYPVYSKNAQGTYSKNKPDSAGTWYVKLKVDGTASYYGLESDPFSFVVVDPGTGKKDNEWIDPPNDKTIDFSYGDKVMISLLPLYGSVDQILFKLHQDTTESWSTTVPKAPGEYDYKLVVNEQDEYTGLVYISGLQNSWISIAKAIRYVQLTCDDIALGEKPSPVCEFLEDEEYADVDLSKITYKYYKSTYDDTAEEWITVEIPESEINVVGEYSVEAVYPSATIEVKHDETSFFVKTAEDLAKDLITEATEYEYLDIDDKALVDKAVKAYNSLTDEQKQTLEQTLGPDVQANLNKASARISYLIAEEALWEKQFAYEDAMEDYEYAKAAADKAKAAADKAAKTTGITAITAASTSKKKASSLVTAAKALDKAAKALKTAATTYEKAAQSDPVLTRLDKQNSTRYLSTATAIAKSAATSLTTATNRVKAANNLIASTQNRYNTAAKSYKVSSFKAKALKKKKAKLTWKANKLATGYQIKYSRKKSMKSAKTVTIKKATTRKATLKNLTAKKKYYIRIRTYTKYKDRLTNKTKTLYGKWSTKKRIKSRK